MGRCGSRSEERRVGKESRSRWSRVRIKKKQEGKEEYIYFFFSSRRRHTRLVSDWSSDVCSSDLILLISSAKPTARLMPPRQNGGVLNSVSARLKETVRPMTIQLRRL